MLPPALAMTCIARVMYRPVMPLRLRKFIGAIALFVLVIVWALVAMALAQMPAIRDNAIALGRLLRDRRPRLGAAGDADRHWMSEPGAVRSRQQSRRLTADYCIADH